MDAMSCKRPTLGEGSRVGYSDTERELFKMLPVDPGKISSRELIERKYGKSAPFNSFQLIGAALRSLSRKVEHNREPFLVARSIRRGPHPIYFWIKSNRRARR
jgi:hypothetical protein